MRQFETKTGTEKGATVASERNQATWRKTLFLICSIGAFVAFFAFAGGASAMRETAATAPSIVSDQADYEPGSTVTIIGGNWGAGESVHIFANDNVGQTWQYNGDATADASGGFTHQFTLPNYFVATYSITATGSSGAVATTTFTDAINTDLSGSFASSSITLGSSATFDGRMTRHSDGSGVGGKTITLASYSGSTCKQNELVSASVGTATTATSGTVGNYSITFTPSSTTARWYQA